MISLIPALLALSCCGMVCDGLGDVISPYGWRLCRDLCETLTSCTSPDYREETLTCVLRNSSGVGEEGARECRTLTSRRGISVTLCCKAVEESKRETFVNVSSIKTGTPVLLSNNLYGYYSGNHKVIYIENHVLKQEKLDATLAIQSVMKYTYRHRSEKISLYQTVRCLLTCRFLKGLGAFDDRDLISYCLTGMTYKKAHRIGFNILT